MKPRCPKHNKPMRLLQFAGKYSCPLRGCDETAPAPSRPRKSASGFRRGPRDFEHALKRHGWRKRRDAPERRVMRDGREILSGAAKRARWLAVYNLDGGRCRRCGRRLDPPYTNSVDGAEVHHVEGRGMGGGKRDDRIFIDGKRNLETLCPGPIGCHRKAGPQLAFTKSNPTEGEVTP